MNHVADGVLRRYLDEPVAVSDADRAHLVGCARCGAELVRAGQDRDAVARALGADDLDEAAAPGAMRAQDDLDQAWAALSARLSEPADRRGASTPPALVPVNGRKRPRLLERVVRRPVAAAVTAGLVALGGTAAAAAADWLPIFRAEKVKPVTISAADVAAIDQLGRLADLSAYGEVVTAPDGDVTEVPDAATAADRAGLTAPKVADLPTGVEGKPKYLVLERQTLEFTFSAEKAAKAAEKAGAKPPPMPSGLDGARLRVQGGPGMVLTWTQRSGIPTLMVARVKAPTVASEGASLPVVRDYLLSMPGIPRQLAAQLRAVTGDGTTLPIPIPADLVTTSQADVDGSRATVVETKDRTAVGAIWVTDGELNVVLGPLSRGEVLAVARGLR